MSKTENKTNSKRLYSNEKLPFSLGRSVKYAWLGLWDWVTRNSILFKLIAIIGIPLLAYSDYNTLLDLFLNEDRVNPRIFAITVAAGLEGLPTLASLALAKLMDKTKHKRNDFGFSLLCFIMTTSAFVLLCTIMIFERLNSETQSDWLVVALPIITSVTAFGLSWLAFRSETIDSLTLHVEYLEKTYHKRVKVFLGYKYQLQDALVALWTEVTDHKTKPTKLKDFREDVFTRAKSKIIEDCRTAFPNQVERYNGFVEAVLDAIIQDMASHSTIPEKIQQINKKEIIETYSTSQASDASKWKYDEAGTALEAELITLINNAISVAQMKAFIYQTEEDSLI